MNNNNVLNCFIRYLDDFYHQIFSSNHSFIVLNNTYIKQNNDCLLTFIQLAVTIQII